MYDFPSDFLARRLISRHPTSSSSPAADVAKTSRTKSGCEGTPAAAASRHLRILENESLPHKRLFEIERRIGEIQKTLRIHENARAIFLDHFVAVARLRFEPHRVGQSRAPAALNAHAQTTGIGRYAFLCEQFAD